MSKIIIAGGGFAGVWAAMAAAATRHRESADAIDITLISKESDLCIRPRLYEGARPEMLVPLAPLLEQIDVTFEQLELSKVSATKVYTKQGRSLNHDRLVLAMGSQVSVPDVPGAKEHGFTVDAYAQTARLDAHLSKLDPSPLVVVGASFSGLEIATALRDRVGRAAPIYLVDQATVAGQSLGSSLTEVIATALDAADIRFLGNDSVVRVDQAQVVLRSGTVVDTRTCIFATGLRPSPLVENIGSQADDGRLQVDAKLRVSEQPTCFAAGDVAVAAADDRHMTLMSCQHAMPMGVVAGQNAVLDLLGKDMLTYAQPEYATCLSLGASNAVFTQGWDRTVALSGEAGAAMKVQINETWIYPPSPELGRDAIFETILPSNT